MLLHSIPVKLRHLLSSALHFQHIDLTRAITRAVPCGASHQCSKWNQPRWEWQKELHQKTKAIPSRGRLVYSSCTLAENQGSKTNLHHYSTTAHVEKPNRACKSLKYPDSGRFYKKSLQRRWSAVNVVLTKRAGVSLSWVVSWQTSTKTIIGVLHVFCHVSFPNGLYVW